jgi:hypothetical protein
MQKRTSKGDFKMSIKALIHSNSFRRTGMLLALIAGIIGASLSLGGCTCADPQGDIIACPSPLQGGTL